MNSKTKGILCIITAAFFFAFMSLCVRLTGDLPSMQKILFRNLLALVIVGVGLIRKPEKIEVHKEDIKYLFLRSFCGTIGIVCNFYAIDHLVLSDANMLNKLSPFFAIIFYRCFVYHQAYRKYGKFRCFCRYDGRRRSRCCVYLCAPVRKKRGQWKIGDHVLFCFFLSYSGCISHRAFCAYGMVADRSDDRGRIWRSRRTDLCYQSLLLCSGKRTFCV